MLAIIGGSNMQTTFGTAHETRYISTPYNDLPIAVGLHAIEDCNFYFLSRHGKNHETVAHRVNYRANIWALKELGVQKILTGATVGSIDSTLGVGDLLVPDQILDFTHSRNVSFEQGYDDEHFDFTEPFDQDLRHLMLASATALEMNVRDGGTYVCTQGPRFETAAEIRFYEKIGGHVVGMTLMPEAALARQISIPYAAFNLVVNPAAGQTTDPIDLHSTESAGKGAANQLFNWFSHIIRSL